MLAHPDVIFRTSIDAHREHLDRTAVGGPARAAVPSPAAPSPDARRVRTRGRTAGPAIGRGRLRTARP